MSKLTAVVFIAGLVAGMADGGVICSGDSASVPIDTRVGARESDGTETLTYSSLWDGDASATVTIAQNGGTLADNLAGRGELEWTVLQAGTYELTHTTYTNGVKGRVETATFSFVKDIASLTIGDISDVPYTGSAIAPDVVVTDSSCDYTLEKDVDYTLSYANNKNAGTATVTVTGKGNYTGSVIRTFAIVSPPCKLTLKPSSTEAGTVSGSGTYAHGKKVTIKAKAKKGYVFAGWFTDKKCTKALNPEGYDNRKPTVKITMPAKKTTYYAKFITKKAAKKSLKFSSATKKLAKTAKKATAGKKFSLKLGISSASLPTVTAKKLPKGLTIDKTTGRITGTATKPGSYTATITVKDAAGNKITQKVKITVNVPSWVKGTYYGLAGIKKDGAWAYLKFTIGTTAEVSGKVMYKGKSHSFKSACKSCTAKKATFSPKVKVGSYTVKPGTVTVTKRTMADLSTAEAYAYGHDNSGFGGEKKVSLVKKGKPLAALVGKTFKFKKKDKNSGLTKSKDKLKVKLGNGDVATVSGTVKGKALKALSWAVLVSNKETAKGVTTYTLYVDIVDASLKYAKTLVITAKVGPNGVKATASFAE